MRNNALTLADMEMQLLIGALVLDAIFCVVAAQLWKKSNRIKPCLASSKVVRTLWHQLGVIMVLVCFLPIGVAESVPRKAAKKPFEERAWFNGFPPATVVHVNE